MGSYTLDFKVEALQLSDKIGIRPAAEKLGIPHSTLLKWRKATNRSALTAYSETRRKQEDAEALQLELEELKRTNAILLETIRNLSAAQAH